MPRIVQVNEVAAVTGEGSANRTGSRFGVYGTDLGILWDNGQGEILVVFGDSYGVGWSSPAPGRTRPTGGATPSPCRPPST